MPGFRVVTPTLVQYIEEGIPFCPADCAVFDGVIGIDGFLAVIATCGQTRVPCDLAGPPGVGIEEFLAIIGLWGPCPC